MFRILILLCVAAFISLIALPVSAQDTIPNPLRAVDVLTDAVEVIENMPLWWIDDVAFHLYDDASAAWTSYVLPIVPDDYATAVQEADGTFRLTLCHAMYYMPYYGANADCAWYLDPATGEFAQVEMVCGGLSAGNSDWIAYVDPTTHVSHMCNIRTGELSAPLPVDLNVLMTTGSPLSMLSIPPSGETLNAAGDTMIIEVYGSLQVFNLTTGATMSLGPMEGQLNYHGGLQWIDDAHAIVVTLPGEVTTPRQYHIYIVDVTQPNSAELLYSGEAISIPNNYYTPRVYDWLESDCTFHELSLDTLEITSYTIPGVCSRGVPLEDGSGDWLVVQNHRVLRYNREQRSVQMLFMDGIGCYDASPAPAGRYQVLYFTTTANCNELAIMDTQNGEIDYLAPHAHGRDRVRWVNGDTLLIYETHDGNDRIVRMPEGEEVPLPPVVTQEGGLYDPFSANGRWILVQPEAGSLAVYDTLNNTTTVIAHNLVDYTVTATWLDDSTLTLQVMAANVPIGQWRVSIRDE